MKVDPVKFGILARLLYNMFIRRILKKAVDSTTNKIDDKALELIDKVAFNKE